MLRDMTKVVAHAIHDIEHPRLSVNDEKTRFVTPRFRRVVTGVTLSNEGYLSIGREKKRLLMAKVHHASLGKLSGVETKILCGDLAFVNVVEPSFISKLKRKYGEFLIQ